MAKVTINGEVFGWDPVHRPMSEALAIEHALKIPYASYERGLEEGSARSIAGFIWLVWRRNGRDVPLDDILAGKVDIDLATLNIEPEEGEEAGGCGGPYQADPNSFEHDRWKYIGVFAEVLHIRPWEIGLLTQDEFEALIDYAEAKADG